MQSIKLLAPHLLRIFFFLDSTKGSTNPPLHASIVPREIQQIRYIITISQRAVPIGRFQCCSISLLLVLLLCHLFSATRQDLDRTTSTMETEKGHASHKLGLTEVTVANHHLQINREATLRLTVGPSPDPSVIAERRLVEIWVDGSLQVSDHILPFSQECVLTIRIGQVGRETTARNPSILRNHTQLHRTKPNFHVSQHTVYSNIAATNYGPKAYLPIQFSKRSLPVSLYLSRLLIN